MLLSSSQCVYLQFVIEISNSRRRILVTTILNFYVITGNLISNRIRRVKVHPAGVNHGACSQRFTRGFAARCHPPAGRSAFGHPRYLTKACRERTSGTKGTLCKDVCVFCAILISKSASRAVFDMQLVYSIRKLVILVILDREKKLFIRAFCTLNVLRRPSRNTVFDYC